MKYEFEKHDLLKVELTSIYDVLSEKDINQIKKKRKDNVCFYNAYMVSKMFKCDYVEGYSLPFAIKHCINRINGKYIDVNQLITPENQPLQPFYIKRIFKHDVIDKLFTDLDYAFITFWVQDRYSIWLDDNGEVHKELTFDESQAEIWKDIKDTNKIYNREI